VHGGEIIAQGTPEEVMANPRSITGKYLTGESRDRGAAKRRKSKPKQELKVIGARGNNLKNVTAEIPLGTVHLRHRRFGRRQVHLPDRDALQGRRAR
jgi:excinuclease ABC subunit A